MKTSKSSVSKRYMPASVDSSEEIDLFHLGRLLNPHSYSQYGMSFANILNPAHVWWGNSRIEVNRNIEAFPCTTILCLEQFLCRDR